MMPRVSPKVVTTGATTSSGSIPFLNEMNAVKTLMIDSKQTRTNPVAINISAKLRKCISMLTPVNIPKR